MGARPLASLSGGLLARPGHAKPAMRPQGFSYASTEDLGWNDMGQAAAPVPPVLTERAELAQAVAPVAPVVRPAPAPVAATEPRVEPGQRSAFTLRLDADRHLQLRLASALSGRSAQRLVIEALDAFLNAHPQVDARARKVPAPAASSFSGEKTS